MRSFKKIVKPAVIAAVFLVALLVLDFALYPCTFMRNDIHAVTTREYEDIILGTSHGKINIDPETLGSVTERSAHNLCVGGEYPIDSYYMTKLILEKQNPSRIIYEIDPGYIVTEKEEGNNYLLFYHEFPLSLSKLEYFAASMLKTNFRTLLFPWYEYSLSYEIPRIGETISQKWNQSYEADNFKTSTQEYHDNGFVERYPVDASSFVKSQPKLYYEGAVQEENMEYLRKLIALCKEKNIEFVAVTTPMPRETLADYEANYRAAWTYFGNFFIEQDVPYLNFNNQYYDTFSHELSCYTDYDGHMNGDSAREYSVVLGKLLNQVHEAVKGEEK
ncbi:MAG: hypothetical protein Q4E89_13065 [Eubacteriales bacterium]|nr:hypothetical protein [Eubacteriales bacterium]